MVWVPEAGLPPLQEPDAEHEPALLLVQESTVICPCSMSAGVAVRLSDGAGVAGVGAVSLLIFTRTVRIALPLAPEHWSV